MLEEILRTRRDAAGGLSLLDRWRLVLLASRIEDRSTLELLDLTTLEVGAGRLFS